MPQKGALYPLNGKILLESSTKCRIFALFTNWYTIKLFLWYTLTVLLPAIWLSCGQMMTGDKIAYY